MTTVTYGPAANFFSTFDPSKYTFSPEIDGEDDPIGEDFWKIQLQGPGVPALEVKIKGEFEFLNGTPISGTVTGVEIESGDQLVVDIDHLNASIDSFIPFINGGDYTGLANLAISFAGNAGLTLDDDLDGQDGDDFLDGFSGDDDLHGHGGDDTLMGGDGSDTVSGGEGADSLRGNAGDDSMRGGLGDDDERGGQGDDTLRGGADDDSVRGGAGEDDIFGGLGDDTLIGGAGNDDLTGGAGNDYLDGKAGNDELTGGVGIDQFVFSTAPGTANLDTIEDFEIGVDRILLSPAAFSALSALAPGALDASHFVTGDGAVAGDADDFLLYDTTSHLLSYDADGNGLETAIAIANLSNDAALTASDIFIA